MELTDIDRAEIARLIIEGSTGGILDDENFRISWELKVEKWKD